MNFWLWVLLGVVVVAVLTWLACRKSDRRKSDGSGGYYSGGQSSGEHVPGRKDSWDNHGGGGDGGD